MIILPDLEFPGFPDITPDDLLPGGGDEPAPDYVKNIALLYEAALNRAADEPGMNFWIDSYESGWELHAIAEYFANSPEFQQEFGSSLDDADYIGVLYNNVLDRAGEQDGVTYWLEQLESGTPRYAVLVDFALSPENRDNSLYVEDIYQGDPGYWLFQ